MAPESLIAVDMELWTQFEEGVEIPRPLRIIKRSGTYTAADGSIGVCEGALIIPRRHSSRTIGTSTISAQQEGPFGCLTIHKKRGRGISTVLPGTLPRDYRIESSSDQLLDKLLSEVSSSSPDWVKRRQEPELHGRNAAQSSTFLPPHQFAKLPTTRAPQIFPAMRSETLPDSSSSFSSSSETPRPSRKTSFFKRPLFLFSKSHKSSHQRQPKTNNSPLRDLVNTPHLKTSSVGSKTLHYIIIKLIKTFRTAK